MSEKSQAEEMRRVCELLGLDADVSQDADEARVRCSLHENCRESGDNNLVLQWPGRSYHCIGEGETGSLRKLIRSLESERPIRLPNESDEDTPPSGVKPEYSVARRATNPASKTQPKVLQLKDEQRLPTREEIEAQESAAREERLRRRSERIIISVIAVIFLLAGLAAAGLSGFANYQAFSMSVADPLQGRVWGFAGVIAAIVSFAGFTFFYWHGANRRVWEAVRSLVFALIGMGASILGTEMYIAANNRAADAEVTMAGSNRAVLETQLADWRRQLAGIPPETRSVEGLEIYIAEVERVGRTEQKPYRDAQNELGLARRRDDLQARIDAATAELLGRGSGDILLQAEARTALPSWLFAAMLELFSSQGTSIGLVALLVLYTRRQRGAAA